MTSSAFRCMHGVGGSFDVLAGVTWRAPRVWQRLGMEWAYRFIQEPAGSGKRYLATNSAFVVLLARERFVRHRRIYRPSRRAATGGRDG